MMRFTLRHLFLIFVAVILPGWLVGCAALPASPAPATPAYGLPALAYPPAPPYAYPPVYPYPGENTAIPYIPPPTPVPTQPPLPTATPTIYPSTIETLSPGELTPELTALPIPQTTLSYTLPAIALPAHAPLMPKHHLVVSFIDQLHGWLLGSSELGEDQVFALASSVDGGQTWQPLPVPASVQDGYFNRFSWNYGDGFYQAQLLFSDALHGWLYQGGLFYTADGGQTWQEQPIQGPILQMDRAVAGFDWALEQTGSQLTLWQIAGETYASWQKLADQFPPVRIPLNATVIDAQNFWISDWTLFLQTDIQPVGSRLFFTREGGKSWSQMSLPAPCDMDPLVLAAVSATEIWMGCGFPAGAGSGISAAFFSGDGGETWQEKWYSTNGYFTDLQAVSRDFVYMTFDYGDGATISYDGGQTWVEGGFSCITNSPQADFVDEQHGWGACDSTVNRTVDGGRSWQCIELTGTKVCFP